MPSIENCHIPSAIKVNQDVPPNRNYHLLRADFTTTCCSSRGGSTSEYTSLITNREEADAKTIPQALDSVNKGIESIKEEKQRDRPQWNNQMEFLFSCIAMAVGVGNVWRFPFVALDNGGGAFLVPYFLVLIFIGKPLYYMEFCLGQFASFGPAKVWEICPAFRGIGYGQMVSTWTVSTFYVSLMALCVYYFFGSFSNQLPWAVCGSWASKDCFDANTTMNLLPNSSTFKTAAEEYFHNEVLKIDLNGFDNGIGLPEWRLSLCIIFSWLVIFVVQVKGIRSSGKAAYFTALFPYVVLLIMLIRGVTLPGAAKGILFFLTPRWEKLTELNVWYAAVDQAFFSLSVGFGIVMMLASYNPFRQNVYRDATIISFMDTFTCVFAGITIFSILGYLAELLGVEIEDVVRGGGTPLAFVSYPDALARFQYIPQLFSALFFLMLFTLGVGSAVPYNQVVITVICDGFPKIKEWQVTLGVCIVGCLVGLIYATPQGQHILALVNYYGGGVSIIFLMVLELVAVMWIYGISNFIRDIDFMLGRKTGLYWKVCWGFFNPLFLLVVFIYQQFTAKPLTYGTYVFDSLANNFGLAISVTACSMVPLFFFIEVIRRRKSSRGLQLFADVFKPTSNWSPREEKLRRDYHIFKNSE